MNRIIRKRRGWKWLWTAYPTSPYPDAQTKRRIERTLKRSDAVANIMFNRGYDNLSERQKTQVWEAINGAIVVPEVQAYLHPERRLEAV